MDIAPFRSKSCPSGGRFMEIRNIETFVMAVENKSFSKAAEILGYTQSTVTVHIKQLEEEFGVLLFERIGKRIHLTEEGAKFYDQAVRIIKEVKSAEKLMTKNAEPNGLLRLGTVASLSSRRIPQQLLHLHERYPLIKIVLDSEDPLTLLDKLRHNELDILYMTSDEISGSDLVTCYEKNEPLHFIAAADHPLAGRKRVSLEEILAQDLVLSERNLSILKKVTGDSIPIEPFLLTGMLNLIMDTVAHSSAVSLLPDYVTAEEIKAGHIVKVPVEGLNEHLELKAVYHKNKWVTPEMEAYISMLPSQ